ncbi:Protein of unknown function [Propionibacterium freudenreichii subsp. freudenreichii]|uniref:Uncharacterized protein n=1 Tax=Propionibacterium freudenreichii subsp. freudenreichii TaxID=66712 RepID=A0A0B7P0Y0_PROFF|nr:Protein of unknown function [Propionibacterium freudenreichii subsp. freudenreichii]
MKGQRRAAAMTVRARGRSAGRSMPTKSAEQTAPAAPNRG